ncbi:glycosyltransferase family 2 protein [Vibrio ordalii]|uniref:glycosyltransferase family 2 protein n=1 Tax=Vibrio ordalii TaxID=28174 RepID=UPI0025775E68|nr:glycosyltransferase family A protein [Vibrio ordalii]MCS0350760.1 glycosyltransferase family 2 protein [Vibrio ordalii]
MCEAPISVIITTYNDHEYLEQAINSIIAQTLLPSEIIVVDDGSDYSISDATIKTCSHKARNVSINFFRKDNGGASSARNFGLTHAKFGYVAFLDVDDRMLPDNLKIKYEIIENLDENYFGVYGGAIRSTGKEEVYSDFDGVIDVDLIDKVNIGIPGGVPFYLFNKDVLNNVGGFDENLYCNEDYDLIIRLFRMNKKCKGSSGSGFYRNLRVNSLSRPTDPMKNFHRIWTFLEKAEKNSFYSKDYLDYRKMELHVSLVKGLAKRGMFIKAIKYARVGFKYKKPLTLKQKLAYFLSFSFLFS